MGQQGHVKPGVVVQVFGEREQVQQQGAYAFLIQCPGNEIVARAVAAAAAAVRKQHNAPRPGGKRQQALHVNAVHRNMNELGRESRCGVHLHGFTRS